MGEFVTDVYKRAGLLEEDVDPAEVLPSYFDSTRRLLLKNGAMLSAEYVLVGPNDEEEYKKCGYSTPYGGDGPSNGGWGWYGTDIQKPIGIKDTPEHDYERVEFAAGPPTQYSMEESNTPYQRM